MPGSSRKRIIDLTAESDGEDVQVVGSHSRKHPRLADVPIGDSDYDDEELDESALDEVVDPSQDYNDRAFIQFMLYGTQASGCQ